MEADLHPCPSFSTLVAEAPVPDDVGKNTDSEFQPFPFFSLYFHEKEKRVFKPHLYTGFLVHRKPFSYDLERLYFMSRIFRILGTEYGSSEELPLWTFFINNAERR